jgi:hypothetical protein
MAPPRIVIEPPLINFWPEAQIAELARHARRARRFVANYVEAIRWTSSFVKVRGEIKGLLQKRLAAGVADERARSRLRLIESQL